MFLKSSLEEKLKRSLSEYNPSEFTKSINPHHSARGSRLRISHSKNDKLNFARDHKKFNDDDVPQKAKEAREYIKELRDPDILELRKKKWNVSTQAQDNQRPELKHTLFEVSHGLRDFNVVKLKEKTVELGTDTRNFCYEGWNGSSLLEDWQKKQIILQKYIKYLYLLKIL
jgi:hypothetical protein